MINTNPFSIAIPITTPIPIRLVQNSNDSIDYMSVIALIISVISIVLTVLQYFQSQKLNDINMEAEYFREVFDSYILIEIPNRVKKIGFTNNFLSPSYKELSDILIDLMEHVGFFKYRNKQFYDNLIQRIYSIDDYLVENSSMKMSREEQSIFIMNLESKVNNLYTAIFSFYLGKTK